MPSSVLCSSHVVRLFSVLCSALLCASRCRPPPPQTRIRVHWIRVLLCVCSARRGAARIHRKCVLFCDLPCTVQCTRVSNCVFRLCLVFSLLFSFRLLCTVLLCSALLCSFNASPCAIGRPAPRGQQRVVVVSPPLHSTPIPPPPLTDIATATATRPIAHCTQQQHSRRSERVKRNMRADPRAACCALRAGRGGGDQTRSQRPQTGARLTTTTTLYFCYLLMYSALRSRDALRPAYNH